MLYVGRDQEFDDVFQSDDAATNIDHLDILCVDDDPDIRTVVTLSLGLDKRIVVCVAADGSEALRMLTAGDYRPNCILLDRRLPGSDGTLLMGEIRCLPRFAETPVIFLTGCVQDRDKADIKSLGAVGVIAKPFDPLDLPSQIRALLKKTE
jgi:two-component system OmpR family response regulator